MPQTVEFQNVSISQLVPLISCLYLITFRTNLCQAQVYSEGSSWLYFIQELGNSNTPTNL